MRTSVMSWGSFTYSHTIFFNAQFRITTFFKESLKFLNFSCALAYGSYIQSTHNFFLKKFMRTSVLCWGTITHTHTIFFAPISESTNLFLGIAQIPQFFVYQTMDKALGTPKLFSQKLYEDLRIQLENHHVYSHHFFYAYFHIYKHFFSNYPNFSIFRVYQPMMQRLRAFKTISRKNFMRTFVLSQATIMYMHTIF